jgi:ribokinase
MAEVGGVAGALPGGDDRVGAEELDVAHEFGDRPVLHDSVRAVLDVRVGEDAHVLRAEFALVAHGGARRAIDEPLVGDIGVGPLIDANEARAGSAGDRQCVQRGVGQYVDADRKPSLPPDTIAGDRHMRRRFGTNAHNKNGSDPKVAPL